MTKPLKLTDKQLMLLSAASQREDRLLALPETLKGGAARALVSKLLAGGLVEEITVSPADPHWRTGEDDQLIGLRITPAGLQAIGVEPERRCRCGSEETRRRPARRRSEARPASAQEPAVTPAPRQQREGTKRALVIALLSREQGASIDDLTTATGWLPHTTRAALTGLRQSGYAITRTRAEDNRTVYRLAPQPSRPARRLLQSRRRSDRDGPRLPLASEGGGGRARACPPRPLCRNPLLPLALPLRLVSGARRASRGWTTTIAQLEDLPLEALCLHWRNHLGGSPPRHLPRWLMAKLLAYRLQAQAHGDLSPATLRLVRGRGGHKASGPKPFQTRSAALRQGGALRPGSVLMREWQGRLEQVMVLEEGFAWQGQQLCQPVGCCQGDHRHELERPPLLRPGPEGAPISQADETLSRLPRRCGGAPMRSSSSSLNEAPALCDLHARVDGAWARAGVQLARQPA